MTKDLKKDLLNVNNIINNINKKIEKLKDHIVLFNKDKHAKKSLQEKKLYVNKFKKYKKRLLIKDQINK